jgi:hypothetical protein
VALNGRSLRRLDLAITLPIAGPDCNSNAVEDSQDIANGTSLDVNASGIPDECEQLTVTLPLEGTAQGGSVTLAVQGLSALCSLTITTSAGQSAAAVAAALAAAVNSDACFQSQGIAAQANLVNLQLTALDLASDDVTLTIADAGLSLSVITIPALSPPGLLLFSLLLLGGAALLIRKRRPPLKG